MNASKTMEHETGKTSIFDPFPEPQTVPKGWDVSNLIPRGNKPAVSENVLELERKYRYPGIMYD